jgi:hypothetical protein
MATSCFFLPLLVIVLPSMASAGFCMRLAGTALPSRSAVSIPPFQAIKRFLSPVRRPKSAISTVQGADFLPCIVSNQSRSRSPNAHRYVMVMAQMNHRKGG